jgi:hypothetical protein
MAIPRGCKVKMRVIVVSTLALILLGGCASAKYIPKLDEEIYGTWTNEKQQGPQKCVMFAGGFKFYYVATTNDLFEEGTQVIEAKWTDYLGNVWYKMFATLTAGPAKGYKAQSLQKVSKSGTELEVAYNTFLTKFDPKNYPTKIDPKSVHYLSFRRAGN